MKPGLRADACASLSKGGLPANHLNIQVSNAFRCVRSQTRAVGSKITLHREGKVGKYALYYKAIPYIAIDYRVTVMGGSGVARGGGVGELGVQQTPPLRKVCIFTA